VISLDTIEMEIRELESRGETTYPQCMRLSWLYTCRDHLKPTDEEQRRTQRLSGSEFLEACSGVSYPAMMQVLDEHMAAIRTVYPNEFARVVAAIKALR
jgi:hypothetical protein